MTHTEILNSFTIENLPDLDVVTLGALELFTQTQLPNIDFKRFKRPLVVGSVNGAAAGKIIFGDTDAVFADESSYLEKLDAVPEIDGAVLISASGAKHAIEIAKTLRERNIETVLLTNNQYAPAREFIESHNVIIFPKNREPYTYNTSTYMSLFFTKTNENPDEVLNFVVNNVAQKIPHNFASYDAFCLIIPPRYTSMRDMLTTKFDELFGPKLVGRVFTSEQMKHAKTVVPSDTELFISFGEENTRFGNKENRLFIPLPEHVDYAGMLAISYFVVGHIQKQFPPYFKDSIVTYCENASSIFGSTINPIVE